MKEKLSLHLETSDKINKKIYRMGFEAKPLLTILSSILIVWFACFLAFGFFNFLFGALLVYGFLKFAKYMRSEIEKGNLRPIDAYFDSMVKPESMKDDGVIEMLLVKKSKSNDEIKQGTTY